MLPRTDEARKDSDGRFEGIDDVKYEYDGNRFAWVTIQNSSFVPIQSPLDHNV